MADQITGLGPVTTFFPETYINWASLPKLQIDLSREIESFPGTVQSVILHSVERPQKQDFFLTIHTLEEKKAFLDFVLDRLAMHKKFWLKSQARDFSLVQNILPSDTSIKVEENGFLRAFRGHERIYIEKKDGTLLTYKITSVASVSSTIDSLEIEAVINQNCNIVDVKKFGFLYLVRFDQDEFELENITDFVSTITVKFTEVIREYEQ